ncbi:hypothetical protein WJ0W_005821 [Paenibacillus melissococcoides]|uniref:Uncharacterized protein n=1 Tax=Paenibacillus melissococcoides TaxID=2912268 RepID=A0ABN8UBR9_9BACL|nr:MULTISPECIES: hypothetical protein [Paenibacillus]MEB9892692.1 hypothetical protein [Bacillus cereus]CAH8248637.1 hypothetical protein WJ0W_005821 [Paenibacillus melissococcoides]CAH8714175.1 hypothetical protein WDD9_003791 [Paenibacillus melissococcoides]CAH8720058.1 hypothetical protein HTL2_005816 [Paenibacillus melissococcoides]GIO81487.1 hypothetical protein J6TS7_50970 [Paenibacillus dendritiformis]
MKELIDCENVQDFIALFHARRYEWEQEGRAWDALSIHLLSTTWADIILRHAPVNDSVKVCRLKNLLAATEKAMASRRAGGEVL